MQRIGQNGQEGQGGQSAAFEWLGNQIFGESWGTVQNYWNFGVGVASAYEQIYNVATTTASDYMPDFRSPTETASRPYSEIAPSIPPSSAPAEKPKESSIIIPLAIIGALILFSR